MDDVRARERVAQVEALLEQLEGLEDAGARELATELVAALLDLYGEGLARIVARDETPVASLAGDELVSHLLLLHGLHPVPLEVRVRAALDEVRPYLASHGGDVELLGVDAGVARLRMEGSCNGCPSSAVTLKLAIEDAIHRAAPDVERIEAEGTPPEPGLLQIEVPGAWAPAGGLADLDPGASRVADVAGERLLLVRLGGRSVYAYRPACPACDAPLAGAALKGARLTCPGCGRRYDVHRAGRCLDDEAVHLDPIPLLVDADETIRVALGAAV